MYNMKHQQHLLLSGNQDYAEKWAHDQPVQSCHSTMQMRIYFPQLGHVGFGVIRALVRDSLDVSSPLEPLTFLDSDGMIGQVLRNQSSAALEQGATLLQVKLLYILTFLCLLNALVQLYAFTPNPGLQSKTSCQTQGSTKWPKFEKSN